MGKQGHGVVTGNRVLSAAGACAAAQHAGLLLQRGAGVWPARLAQCGVAGTPAKVARASALCSVPAARAAGTVALKAMAAG